MVFPNSFTIIDSNPLGISVTTRILKDTSARRSAIIYKSAMLNHFSPFAFPGIVFPASILAHIKNQMFSSSGSERNSVHWRPLGTWPLEEISRFNYNLLKET